MNAIALLAVGPVAAWTLGDWLVAVVVIAAVVGIVYAATNYFGIPIPPIVLRIVSIVLVAALAIGRLM